MSLFNLQILKFQNTNDLRAEIEAIGADSSSLNRHNVDGSTNAIKLEGISPKLARFLYQEMMLEGGAVGLPARMDDRSSHPVDVLIIGTQIQFRHLVVRIRTQNEDELNLLADELERALALA